jgi:hypothetical protein
VVATFKNVLIFSTAKKAVNIFLIFSTCRQKTSKQVRQHGGGERRTVIQAGHWF